MTLTGPTLEEFDAIGNLFEVLAEWANEIGKAVFLPWTSEWQNLGANAAWAVRIITTESGSLQFQAAFDDQLFLDLQAGTSSTKVRHSVETRIDMEAATMTVKLGEDGVQREDIFENGKHVAIRYEDLGAVKPWVDVINFYNDLGQRTEKITNLEDGRQRQDLFDNGLRTTTILTDFSEENDFGWDQIISDYDATGQRTTKTTIYDDGSERVETFTTGVRTLISRTDAGGESWDTIETFFTPFGDLEGRTVTYDDGSVRAERFFEDLLVEVVQSDLLDTKDWFTIDRQYDELGQVERKETVFDDGDITIMTYVEGHRTARVELDGDGDQDWEYRVTYYDETGVNAVETYFEGDTFDFEAFDADEGAPPSEDALDESPTLLPDLTEPDFIL